MILAGLRSLDSISGSRYYGQLMEKLQTGASEFVSGRDSMLIDLSSWYKGSLAPKIEEIQSAIENRHFLNFHYYAPSGESRRRIEPYYLVFRWSSWYVWGWCTDRQDYRLFKLNRMDQTAESDQMCIRDSAGRVRFFRTVPGSSAATGDNTATGNLSSGCRAGRGICISHGGWTEIYVLV